MIVPERNVPTAWALGMLHWMRCLALPAGSDHEDHAAAARYLSPTFDADLRRVPSQMRRQLERYRSSGEMPGAGPEEGRIRALGLIARYQRDGDPALLAEAVPLLSATAASIPEQARQP